MIWNKRPFLIIISSVMFLMLAAGCLKNDLEERRAKENKIIQQYLTAHNISSDTNTEGGIYFIDSVAGVGSSPVLGDYVVLNFVVRYLETGIIRETSYDSLRNEWEAAAYYDNFLFGPVKIPYGQNIAGINEGLSLMKEGGIAIIIIPSDKAYYDDNPLIYEIELLKIFKDPIVYADSLLETYCAENGFDTTTKFEDIWFRETYTPNPEDTIFAKSGDLVTFRFSGKLIDEFRNESNNTFDTNLDLGEDPIKFVYGNTKVSSGSIITPSTGLPAGLIDALSLMREGTHASAVINYNQAFSEKGLINSIYRYTIIPTYQNVVYDIIVEDIFTPTRK